MNILNERNMLALNPPRIDVDSCIKNSLRFTGALLGTFAGMIYTGYFESSVGKLERNVTIWEDSKVAAGSIIFFGGVFGFAVADSAIDYFFPDRP